MDSLCVVMELAWGVLVVGGVVLILVSLVSAVQAQAQTSPQRRIRRIRHEAERAMNQHAEAWVAEMFAEATAAGGSRAAGQTPGGEAHG
jgi:hypothetical protein